MGVNQRPVPPRGAGQSTDRIFKLTLMVGFGIGVVVSAIVFTTLLLGGFIDGFSVEDQVACEDSCPPLALELYHTLEAEGLLGEGGLVLHAVSTQATQEETLVEVITLTPSPTTTGGFGPTATAACATFVYQFPGTPCPTTTPTLTPNP